MKSWLQDNNIEMPLTHNERKSVEEQNLQTVSSMTAVAKNAYIDTIDNIVDKDNNTYHKTIKMNNIYV